MANYCKCLRTMEIRSKSLDIVWLFKRTGEFYIILANEHINLYRMAIWHIIKLIIILTFVSMSELK